MTLVSSVQSHGNALYLLHLWSLSTQGTSFRTMFQSNWLAALNDRNLLPEWQTDWPTGGKY